MHASESQPAPGHRETSVVLHAAFIVTGAVTTLLGPLLPLLIARWSLRDAQAGVFFTLQFCGNLAGLATVGTLLARRGYRFTLSLGFALMAAGVGGMLASGPFEARVCTVVFGGGLGLTISGVNLWVGEDSGPRRATALSLLNMCWGLGAIAFPPLVLLAQREHLLLELMLATASLCGISAVFLAVRGAEPRAAPWHAAAGATANAFSPAGTLAVLGCLFFVYVGTEACVSGWIAALAKRIATAGTPDPVWPLAPMFFWAGLLTGRGAVPLVLRVMSESGLLRRGLLLATVGTAALLSVQSFAGTALCAAVAGLGMACVFPLLAAWMFTVLGREARRKANLLFALGCAGGATLPWLVGLVSSRTGDLRSGLLVPVAGCLAMVSLVFLFRRRASS